MFKRIRPWLFPGKDLPKVRRFLIAPLLRISVIAIIAAIVGHLYFQIKAFSFSFDELDKVPERTLVFDRNGDPLGHVTGHGENRVVVSLDEISPHFVAAILAREDSRFYNHGGIDYRGVVRAALRNLRAGDFEQGASTITMQLARNAWGLKQRTLARKFQEVALARRLEWRLSKDEILEHYLNRIYFGSGLYGIERAADGYFKKSAKDLTLGESALLAGVIRGPSLLNPFRNLETSKSVRDEVLDRLVAEETITAAEAEAAKKEALVLRPPSERTATGSYVLQTIHDLLGDLLKDEEINAGGLRVTTTIDPAMQEAAQRGLDAHLTKIESRSGFPQIPRSAHKATGDAATKYVQGAVVSLENETGAILSMVGGRDFGESSFNRALEAERQCGSTFKPFVYLVAFDRGGLIPGTWISDDPIKYKQENGKIWSPGNSDGQFLGNQPAAVGLIRSRNTMSVRVGELAGLQNVRDLARALKMGEIPESPVSFLGAFDTTPMTLTSAYSTIATGGHNRAPYLIERIENAEGELLFAADVRNWHILRESVCWLTTNVLEGAMNSGTGSQARALGYTKPCYGKTGTTNDYRDAWFVGYTDKVTTGVWVGLDKPSTIMSRGYGSTLALPVWVEVMKTAETSGFPAADIPPPADIQEYELCRACGGRSQRRSIEPYFAHLPRELRPDFKCDGHGGPGGIFDLFGWKKNKSDARYPNRDDDEESNAMKALRSVGRFIFGPSK